MDKKELTKKLLDERIEFCNICGTDPHQFYAYENENKEAIFVCEKCHNLSIGQGKIANGKELNWKLIVQEPLDMPDWNEH